jgi:hypothetical protein
MALDAARVHFAASVRVKAAIVLISGAGLPSCGCLCCALASQKQQLFPKKLQLNVDTLWHDNFHGSKHGLPPGGLRVGHPGRRTNAAQQAKWQFRAGDCAADASVHANSPRRCQPGVMGKAAFEALGACARGEPRTANGRLVQVPYVVGLPLFWSPKVAIAMGVGAPCTWGRVEA